MAHTNLNTEINAVRIAGNGKGAVSDHAALLVELTTL
jgi:hypothetical protein